MLRHRPSDERGHLNFGWLDTRHSFSFGEYHDPERMGFRTLRVINEDHVAPGQGFGAHGHRDMEILTWVLDGALQHRDSLGSGSVIRPGDLQHMTAGSGIRHSEMNASATDPVHLLQIWILPERAGLTPGYGETHFAPDALANRLRLVASPDGRDGSITIRQDATLSIGRLDPGARVRHEFGPGRAGWVQVARGRVTVGGEALAAGDAVEIEDESAVEIVGVDPAEVLLFDVA